MSTHRSSSLTNGHEKTLTISSTATAVGDPYPSSPMVTSPGYDSFEFGDADSVPPSHRHRTLVLCFDGTGQSPRFRLQPVALTPRFRYPLGDQFDDDVSLPLLIHFAWTHIAVCFNRTRTSLILSLF